MELYKIIEGQLVKAPINLEWVDDEGIKHCETPAQESTLRSRGWKDAVRANIQPPLKWFQDAILTYNETEKQIIEGWEVVSKHDLRKLVTDYYNAICDNAILTGFYFKGMNLWLTTETQTNLSTDFLASSIYQELTTYPKYYNFDGQLWPLNNLMELAELFNAAKDWKTTCLTECWVNKLLDITDEFELYNALVDLNR